MTERSVSVTTGTRGVSADSIRHEMVFAQADTVLGDGTSVVAEVEAGWPEVPGESVSDRQRARDRATRDAAFLAERKLTAKVAKMDEYNLANLRLVMGDGFTIEELELIRRVGVDMVQHERTGVSLSLQLFFETRRRASPILYRIKAESMTEDQRAFYALMRRGLVG